MHFSLILLHLAGATMLLLWAVRMVRTGVERAHGAVLKNALRNARGGKMKAAGAGAMLAVVLQSSTAVAILASGFAASGILTVSTGIAILLGADLGSALVVQVLSFDLSWLVPVLIVAGGLAAVAALLALQIVEFPVGLFGATEGRQMVNLHLAFNLALVVCCLPMTGVVERLVTRLIPDKPAQAPAETTDLMSRRISALDRSVIRTPGLALASATRELLRMGEVVEIMLRPMMDFFEAGKPEQIRQAQKLDEDVNRAHTDIKLYIAEVNRGAISEQEAKRGIELTDFAINLERAGDVVAKNLLVLALEKRSKKLDFSREGRSELSGIHDRVMANMQLALNVLVSGDLDSARQLVVEKERMRRWSGKATIAT
jgi:phosphate:Na+ symporter